VEPGFFILKFNNETDETQTFKREVHSNFIQFHFCIKGSASFVFNEGNYTLPLAEDNSLLLYNPQRDLPIHVKLGKHSWLLSMLLPINKCHGLFSAEANYIPFLNGENKDRKYYRDAKISPSMAIVLNQLMNHNLHPTIKPLYFKGKAYELISLYFNRPAGADMEQCPFLADEENVSKIKKAKQIIISKMAEPPTLQELADEINLPINRLK